MNEELNGLNGILISIICCIVFFTYHAIPVDTADKEKHSITPKAQSGQNEEPGLDKIESVAALVKTTDNLTTQHQKPQPEPKQQLPANPVYDGPQDLWVISMSNSKYEIHKKPIVEFTHAKHIHDYKISCGSCHHDEKGKPLTLTFDDKVDNCIICHTGTQKIKGEKISKKEKVMKYHSEAIHANCISCHKAFNIEKGDPKGKQPAPTSCNLCHVKKS